ncbi:hypothetical protein [Streptomyces bambusae]|uniref:NACHT domain-containing protein n=1 Tax=Streptomyces bambusae TaxID=1550616 RepID=A0ABS6Z7E3_9ACTN|nr:hypothetical protein [Streptomyces bambusae]MBW5482615.1 hypothetical protein [Streptomyces bambusae]
MDVTHFAKELRALYEAAGGGTELGLKNLVSLGEEHGFKVADSTISGWMSKKRPSVPLQERHVRYVLRVLIPYLEERACRRSPTHRKISPEGWQSRLRSAQQSRKSRQGGKVPRIDAESVGRLYGHSAEVRQAVLPLDFEGRHQELDELAAFARASVGRGPAYAYWQADAWAGKSALLAWFVHRHLPAGVDAVSYFIAGRLGTHHRDSFLRDVADQLAAVAGKKRTAPGPRRPDQLHELYEAAAQASAARKRTLLLVVDGLDEDGGAGPGEQSIAALLPKNPPPGMRVIVSGRPNPSVPEDVSEDHPLRDPSIVRRLAASPEARVVRDMAVRDLHTLLADPVVGQPLVGLLAVARGALSGDDVAELVSVLPYDVDYKLRSVAGRNLAPDDTDRLAVRDVAGEPHLRMYVLAHEELRRAAAAALGRRQLARYEAQLHAWAATYRAAGWPPDTPDYLLTGYTRLTQHSAAADQLAALVLDPLRQLRLVARSGVDIALSDLDLAVAPDTVDPLRDLAVLAGVAASREFLLHHARTFPRSVSRAAARLGDARRATAMAMASPHAIDKAAALTGVADVLADIGHDRAEEIARGAATWACTARSQALPFAGEAEEAEGIAARAAVVLIATRQKEAGLELLRSTRGTSTARCEAWADAVRLLLPNHPVAASELLDEMEAEAEDLAQGADAGRPEEDPSIAVQIWSTLAAISPQSADRFLDRIAHHVQAIWAESPTLENVTEPARAAIAAAEGDESGDRDGSRDGDRTEVDRLAGEAFRLADLGKDHEANQRLDEALALLPYASGPEHLIAWMPALAGALVRIGSLADAEAIAAEPSGPHDRARVLAAVSLAYVDTGQGTDARKHAHEAAHAARAALAKEKGDAAGAWAHAAQALACAGEPDAALQLIDQAQPQERLRKAAWRSAARQARIAVAEGTAVHAPAAAARLVEAERERLVAGRSRPRGLAGLLAGLASLLPAAAGSQQTCQDRLSHAVQDALDYATEPPQAWQAETVLVHALLRIGAGEDVDRQLDWLHRDTGTHRPEHSSTIGLAIVHALLGDISEARRVADLLVDPGSRAAAFAAVAGHLARVPARVAPVRAPDPGDPDPFVHTLRALALAASPTAAGDAKASAGFVRQALAGAGWHHALPVLAQIAPETVAKVRDIALVHLRSVAPA